MSAVVSHGTTGSSSNAGSAGTGSSSGSGSSSSSAGSGTGLPTTGAPYGSAVLLAAASCSAARSGAFAPWVYWSGSVIAVLQVIGGIALLAKSGFFAVGGAFSFIAPLTALVWVAAVSVVLFQRVGLPPTPRAQP